MKIIRRYGLVPDLADHRDRLLAPRPRATPRPAHVTLAPRCPAVVDQGSLGSCVANAITAWLATELNDVTPLSRLFVYWYSRRLAGSEAYDSGAYLRDAFKGLHYHGASPEAGWPYSDDDPGPYLERPDDDVFSAGLSRRIVSYHRLESLEDVRVELADGHPVAFGFSVPESFEGPEIASTGVMRQPSPTERILGGHAVLAVGYDDIDESLLVRNSWGDDWGMSGYFTFPYRAWPVLSIDSWAGRVG